MNKSLMSDRHVGWSDFWGSSDSLAAYYDESVLEWISNAVMLKTMGLDKRPIRVSRRVVENVLDSFLNSHRPYSGDMFTRYHIVGDGNFSGDFPSNGPSFDTSNVGLSSNHIINQVVEFMVEYLTTEYGINATNKSYSAWSALYGANDFGLRAHSTIKTRLRRPAPFQFHMKF